MGAVREYCDRAVLITDGLLSFEGNAGDTANEYLKLFNKSADNSTIEQTSKRWGTGSVEVSDIKINLTDDEVHVNITLTTAKEPVDEIVLGFRITDGENRVIAGANNLNVEGSKKLSMSSNQKLSLDFIMPNIFGNGTFNVSVTVRSPDKVTIYDNWDDVASFSVAKDEAYYPILCPARLVTKEK